jgi:hypothetical protein
VRATAELNPPTEVTVMVEVAETPGAPDVVERAPFVTVKLGEAPPKLYFATKASMLPALELNFGE